MRKALFSIMLFSVAIGAWAQPALVSFDLDQPVIEAGRASRGYLKVGMRGRELERADARPALNLSLVLDRSGSMHGERLDRAKEAALYALDFLDERDWLSIVTYESDVEVILPSTKVTDKRRIRRLIEGIESAGSTALFAGVSAGAREVRKRLERGLVNRVILLSDGLANVGPDSPAELGRLGAALREEGISVTTIGLGQGYNEDLMTRLASRSDGNHAFVERPRDLVAIFEREFKDALSVSASGVSIKVKLSGGAKPLGVLGRDAEIRGGEVILDLNQLYAGQEKYVLIEVELPAGAAGASREIASLDLAWLDVQSGKDQRYQATAKVAYTAKPEEAKKSLKSDIAADVAVQQAALASEKALELRDQGKLEEAQATLKASGAELKAKAAELGKDMLFDLAQENLKVADELESADWNVQRKEMRARQYELQNQMGGAE